MSDPLSHRESSNSYSGELLRLGKWRVATCREWLQWLLQVIHALGGRMEPDGRLGTTAQTRNALIRLWTGATGDDGAVLRAMLPEHIARGATIPRRRSVSDPAAAAKVSASLTGGGAE